MKIYQELNRLKTEELAGEWVKVEGDVLRYTRDYQNRLTAQVMVMGPEEVGVSVELHTFDRYGTGVIVYAETSLSDNLADTLEQLKDEADWWVAWMAAWKGDVR